MSDRPTATSAARWVVLVTKGADAGACLTVGDGPRPIGRGADNDLVLSDRAVSRKHLVATADEEGVVLRVVSGAAVVARHGREVDEVHLGPSEVLVIGDTALTVIADRSAGASASDSMRTTDTRSLLAGGLAADLRGLSAAAKLVDALDRASAFDDVARTVATWAQDVLRVSSAALVPQEALAELVPFARLITEPWALVEIDDASLPGGTAMALGVHGGAALVVRLAVARGAVDDDLRRLLAVAARLVSSSLAHLRAQRILEEDVSSLRQLAVGSARGFLGTSPAAERVTRLIPKLAASDATALVVGESGTGKTFLARLIHEASPRAKEPLRVINCAAIPDNLLESELFGHERGAFTGAQAARAGAFEAVGRGTLLLDETGELPLTSQAKLLRVLEERRFERIGTNRSLALEARVLAATNRDLSEMIEKGTFRRDLFFRVSVVSVVVPPLRDRGGDVVLLAEQLLRDLAGTAGRRVAGFSKAARELLLGYSWPGNVRELRNAIEHALVLGEGLEIDAVDLPATLHASAPRTVDGDRVQLPARLDWLEDRAIEAALAASSGNRTKAAAILGINRVTLYKKLRAPMPGVDEE